MRSLEDRFQVSFQSIHQRLLKRHLTLLAPIVRTLRALMEATV
jgi:hypothetical protein